jgi:hypothetical protein
MRRGQRNRYEPTILSTEENNRLVEWTRRHKSSQGLALRAQTIGKWRGRFHQARLDGRMARASGLSQSFDGAVANHEVRFWPYTSGGRHVDVTHDQRARHEAIIAEIRRELGE